MATSTARSTPLRAPSRELHTDILIAGGGLGAVAGALAALRLGRRVILAAEHPWLGGQWTAQAVPPDEHPWIEWTGCTASYRLLRNRIRARYRRHEALTPSARAAVHLNPGGGLVSALCCEPRIAHAAIEELLAPYLAGGQLTILNAVGPVAAEAEHDRVRAVTLSDLHSGEETVVTAAYFLDATDLGDLLSLAGVEHIIGAESQADTGELHALPGDPDPFDQQAITWCMALEHRAGEDHTIDRPASYTSWRDYRPPFWPGPLFGWTDVNPITLAPRRLALFAEHEPFDLWRYRRVVDCSLRQPGACASDVTIVNWPQNDYWLGPLLGVSAADKERHLAAAREQSLCWLYWLQTEAPHPNDGSGDKSLRPDGGSGYKRLRPNDSVGYKGLRLRPDITGTPDGLAQAPYIRESRRIRAEFTVCEQHIGVEQRAGDHGVLGFDSAEQFPDSVGIGSYRIDLHPSTAQRTYLDVSSYPFQIPLGALIPQRVENLLPAAKNLGVTHITNGCYRLHPVEWNIGEAAGALAAHCLTRNLTPRHLRATTHHLQDFQRLLTRTLHIPLSWPPTLRSTPR
jgi:hypothetical protein